MNEMMNSKSFTIDNILRCDTPPRETCGPCISTPKRNWQHSLCSNSMLSNDPQYSDSAIDLQMDSRKAVEDYAKLAISDATCHDSDQNTNSFSHKNTSPNTRGPQTPETEFLVVSADEAFSIFNSEPVGSRRVVVVSYPCLNLYDNV